MYTQNTICKRGVVPALAISLLFVLSILQAQEYGRITGTVVEEGTRSSLWGANVVLVGTPRGAATDAQGHFLITSVPPGTYEIAVNYIGYEVVSSNVQVEAGQTATLDFAMRSSIIAIDAVTVTAERQLQTQAAALNAQFNASNIRNVISSDLMGSFPDEEAVEALSRIPGVIVDGDEVIMRGMPAEWALVTVNGEKIPAANAAEDRSASLETFPVDLIQAIEVSKGQTADMEADAISGSINFILKDAPSKRMFSGKIYSGYSTDRTSDYPIGQIGFFGPLKANLLIGDSFLDGKLGYSIAGTFKREAKSEYNDRNAWNFEDKYWERYQNSVNRDGESTGLGLRYHRRAATETRETRAGFNAAILYKPALGHKLTLKTYYSAYNLTDYDLELTDDHTYYRPDKEKEYDGEIAKLNDVKHEPKHVMNVALGGEHLVMGDLNVDYTLHYTNGRGAEAHDVQAEFVSSYEDRADGDLNMYFSENNFEDEVFIEDEYIAAFNLKKPFYMGNISGFGKAGFKYKYKDRYQQKLDSKVELFDEDLTEEALADLEDDDIPYPKDWTTEEYDPYIKEWDPPMNMTFITESSTDMWENYTANESIIAGYLMAELWWGRNIMVLPGVRVEKTSTESAPRLIETFLKNNPEYESLQAADKASGDYTDIFPSLHARFKLPRDINLRLSASKGISRPSFMLMVGYNDYKSDDLELKAGNPDLVPTKAMNLDIILEHYSPRMASYMSAGFFYKDIEDVMMEVNYSYDEVTVVNGYDVLELEIPENVGSGKAQGIELSIQRQLDFLGLPEIGILANWTHQLEAYLITDEGEKETLPRQAEDVMNIAMSVELSKIGFSGRLSYQYLSKIFNEYDDGAAEWTDARNTLDLNLRQKVTSNVKVFLNARNLLGEDKIRRYQNINEDTSTYNEWFIYDQSHRGMEIYGGIELAL